MKAGLIINPASGKANGKGRALAGLLQGSAGIPVRMLEDFSDLRGAVDTMAAAGVSELFISSGDGTIQAIQTILAEEKPFAVQPRLGLLPHGTTNMTAADLGLRPRGIAAQAQFIRHPVAHLVEQRPTLRVANPRDGKPRHGMFLGTGAVWRGTLFCQEAVHKSGLKGDFATFATLALTVVKSLVSRPDADDADRIDKAYPMTVRAQGRTFAQGPQLMMLATTLEKLILGTRPFWGGHHGALRASVFPYPVPSVARWLIPLMYGGEDRTVPTGAESFSGSGFEVETETPFVIDGEFFDPPKGEPLKVELGTQFDYIRS